LKLLTKDDLAEADHDLIARGINLHKVMAHSPKATRAFRTFAMYTRFESKLDGRLRELAILQVGYSCKSRYEYSHHVKVGRQFGLSDDDIRAVAADTKGQKHNLEPLARTVLRAAREMVADLKPSASTYAELERAFSAEHLVDFILTVSLYCCVVRFLESFEVEVEPDYLPYLEEFPLD